MYLVAVIFSQQGSEQKSGLKRHNRIRIFLFFSSSVSQIHAVKVERDLNLITKISYQIRYSETLEFNAYQIGIESNQIRVRASFALNLMLYSSK